MKKSLFIVRAPFQILSAVEAQYHFKVTNSVIIYIENRDEHDNNICRSALDLFKLKAKNHKIEIITLEKCDKKGKFRTSLDFAKDIKERFQSEVFENVFVGDIFSTDRKFIQQILALNVQKENLILLEDGLKTSLEYFDKFYKYYNRDINHSFPYKFGHKFKLFLWRLFKFNTKLSDKIRVFSFVNLADNFQNANIEIVKNRFKFFGHLINEHYFVKDYHDFYFIGSVKLEIWKMNEEAFVKMMEKVYEVASNTDEVKNIYYIPHRNCSEKTFEIVEKIGFKIKKFTKPIELEFFEKRVNPIYIATTTSTAILSLKSIFSIPNKNSLIFKVPESHIIEKNRDALKITYQKLANENLKIVDLDFDEEKV